METWKPHFSQLFTNIYSRFDLWKNTQLTKLEFIHETWITALVSTGKLAQSTGHSSWGATPNTCKRQFGRSFRSVRNIYIYIECTYICNKLSELQASAFLGYGMYVTLIV